MYPDYSDYLFEIEEDYNRERARIEMEFVDLFANYNDDGSLIVLEGKNAAKEGLNMGDRFKLLVAKIVASIRKFWVRSKAKVHEMINSGRLRLALEQQRKMVKNASKSGEQVVTIPDYDHIANVCMKVFNEVSQMEDKLIKLATFKKDTNKYDRYKEVVQNTCEKLTEEINKEFSKTKTVTVDQAMDIINRHGKLFAKDTMFGAAKVLNKLEVLAETVNTMITTDKIMGDETIAKAMEKNKYYKRVDNANKLLTGASNVITKPIKFCVDVISKFVQFALSKAVVKFMIYRP